MRAAAACYRFPSPLLWALCRAAAALVRAAMMARFFGSATYLCMASRRRRRLPSVRHFSEQYARGLPGFLTGVNSLPHVRHLAAASRLAGRRFLEALLWRVRTAFRHSSEQ